MYFFTPAVPLSICRPFYTLTLLLSLSYINSILSFFHPSFIILLSEESFPGKEVEYKK